MFLIWNGLGSVAFPPPTQRSKCSSRVFAVVNRNPYCSCNWHNIAQAVACTKASTGSGASRPNGITAEVKAVGHAVCHTKNHKKLALLADHGGRPANGSPDVQEGRCAPKNQTPTGQRVQGCKAPARTAAAQRLVRHGQTTRVVGFTQQGTPNRCLISQRSQKRRSSLATIAAPESSPLWPTRNISIQLPRVDGDDDLGGDDYSENSTVRRNRASTQHHSYQSALARGHITQLEKPQQPVAIRSITLK